MSVLELEALPQVPPLHFVQTSASAAVASPSAVASQLIAALIVGLLTAFALQFLLTNLGIAVGISALGWGSKQSAAEPASEHPEEDRSEVNRPEVDRPELGDAIAKISVAAGFGILLTLSLVLFVACFLATTFSQVTDPVTGAIIGITIWSAYFLILLWLSSSAVSSLIGILLGSAASGFRQMVRVISKVLSNDSDRALTAEEVDTLVQRELQTALAAADLRQPLVDYLEALPPPQVDLETIRNGFAELLTQLDFQPLVESGAIEHIDRQVFVDLVNRRTDLDATHKEQVIDQLEAVWQDAIAPQAEPGWPSKLLNFIKTARPEQLRLNQLAAQLQQWLDQSESLSAPASSLLSVLAEVDFRSIRRSLLRRLDLTDLDIETIWQQLQTLRPENSPDEDMALGFSTIQTDVEDYLLHIAPWQLQTSGLEQEFREVLYDPEADPEQVRSQLERMHSDFFQTLLQQRQDIEPAALLSTVERLEAVRQDLLAEVKTAALEEQSAGLQQWLAHFLQTVESSALEPDRLSQTLTTALAGLAVSPEVIRQVFSESDRDTFYQILKQRPDFKKKDAKRLSKQFLPTRDRLLNRVDDLEAQIQDVTETLWQKLTAYLRHTKTKQLTPKGINRKLKALLSAAHDQLVALQSPLPELDWQALSDVLSRRKGLSVRQRQSMLSEIETVWDDFQQQSAALLQPRQHSSTPLTEQLAEQLTDYFQMVAGETLDLEELQQRILKEVGAVGLGGWMLRHQLSQVDWQSLGDRLRQGGHWSDSHLQQLLDQTRFAVRRLMKTPKRWAIRSPATHTLLADIENYLQYANKAALAPEAMQHSLQSLLQTAQAWDGQDAIATTLEQLTRLNNLSILQILSRRDDLRNTEADAIADQFATVQQSLVEQLQQAQTQAQSNLSDLFEQLAHAFETFDLIPSDYREITHQLSDLLDQAQPQLSELNQHLQSVLKDLPADLLQGSWDSVRDQAQQLMGDRLLGISQDAVTTLLQSQHDVSEAIRQSWLGQVETLRDRVLEQVAGIRQTVEARLELLHQQTQHRIEETRKAAALAAWWLFATTLSAGVSAAIAGVIAVIYPLY